MASRRIWRWLIGAIVLVIVAAVVIVDVYGDEAARRRIESEMNAQLEGYTARLPAAKLHLLGFSITLENLRVTQQAHPDPPVILIPRLDAGVDWRALFRLRLVAHFVFTQPRLDINLTQATAEANNPTPMTDEGWQRAVESIYPLKINRVEVRDGSVTYVDDPKRPLRLHALDVVAENIRNIRSPDHTYPSTFYARGRLFESGQLEVDGRADFLAEPHATLDTDINLERVPLSKLDPVATHANIKMAGGILSAKGHVEYTKDGQTIRLQRVGIDGLRVAYVHTEQTANKETEHLERAKEAARQVSNAPTTLIRIDQLALHNSELAYADADAGYRLFLSDATVNATGVSNQVEKDPATVEVRGKFMGSGPATLKTTFRPINKTPDFDLAMKIEQTQLSTLNQVFRAYGNFDVAAGTFALYSEMGAHDGTLRGYVKPFFNDMKVYDPNQDRDKPLLNKIYESAVGGTARILENSNEDVATDVDISGRLDDPNVSTWQVAFGLIRNAFIKSILPGFKTKPRQQAP